MPWGYAFATAKGAVHGAEEVCQDSVTAQPIRLARGEEGLVFAVSDGAGSAKLSHLGSQVAVQAFCSAVAKRLAGKSLATLESGEVFRAVQVAVAAAADEADVSWTELSATLLGGVLSRKRSIFFQVGDGAMVVLSGGGWTVPIWPQNGEYINETTFLTSPDAEDNLVLATFDGMVEAVVAFTDGLQYLVLDHAKQTVHEPFFQSVVGKLRGDEGEARPVAEWLKTVLASGPVVNKTDDDTAILVARREK